MDILRIQSIHGKMNIISYIIIFNKNYSDL